MTPNSPTPHYFLAFVLAASSIPLGLAAGLSYAVGVVLLAVVSFIHTRELLLRIHKLAQQKHFLEEELARGQQLSTLDELSAGIAHEINNPLAIIGQEAQWIRHVLATNQFRHLEGIADCEECAGEITTQIHRCTEIVHKLLSLARQMEPVFQSVDLNSLVESITVLVERDATPRNINIIRIFEPDFPPVFTDAPLLRQVILNLLINARHAIERDGTITVQTLLEHDDVQIEIADTGCGIPEENLGKIFTPFFSTKLHGKGSGLGLAICRGIIERLGGYISVTSEVGKSTTFTVHLPLKHSSKGA